MRLGSAVLAFSSFRIGAEISVLAVATFGSSISTARFVRLGSCLSAGGSAYLGASVPSSWLTWVFVTSCAFILARTFGSAGTCSVLAPSSSPMVFVSLSRPVELRSSIIFSMRYLEWIVPKSSTVDLQL